MARTRKEPGEETRTGRVRFSCHSSRQAQFSLYYMEKDISGEEFSAYFVANEIITKQK